MIYFTSYAHLKQDVFHEGRRGKRLSFGELLLAAGVSGMPAAYLTTPAGESSCVSKGKVAEASP